MDKENMAYIHKGTWFRLKEGILVICDNMNEPQGILPDEISQAQKDKYCMISFMCGI
jgi:hypothetical protein